MSNLRSINKPDLADKSGFSILCGESLSEDPKLVRRASIRERKCCPEQDFLTIVRKFRIQNYDKLTGGVEGGNSYWAGGSEAPTPITEGAVTGNTLTFKAGRSTYNGAFTHDTVTLTLA